MRPYVFFTTPLPLLSINSTLRHGLTNKRFISLRWDEAEFCGAFYHLGIEIQQIRYCPPQFFLHKLPKNPVSSTTSFHHTQTQSCRAQPSLVTAIQTSLPICINFQSTSNYQHLASTAQLYAITFSTLSSVSPYSWSTVTVPLSTI